MQGFRLTQEAKDAGFSGGSVNATDRGHLFDIGHALTVQGEDGPELDTDRVFYINDDLLGEVLASHPALERIPTDEIPEDAVAYPSPRQLVSVGQTNPYTPQTSDVIGMEVAAVHADEPRTEAEAIAVGQAVAGPQTPSTASVVDPALGSSRTLRPVPPIEENQSPGQSPDTETNERQNQ